MTQPHGKILKLITVNIYPLLFRLKMKFFAVVLIIILVCFIHASKLNKACGSHKECGQRNLGCFEGSCRWVENYLLDKKNRDTYFAESLSELGDPCVLYKQCSRIPKPDADRKIICYETAYFSRKKIRGNLLI
ncbi:uncharacterized protein LOC141535266 [Cotesia typhae]|uniref:uncharacterized protein LOC141535266 n=1 Tax=Cotesia typhae TaxID=2053667 RepID=UPI003D68FB32